MPYRITSCSLAIVLVLLIGTLCAQAQTTVSAENATTSPGSLGQSKEEIEEEREGNEMKLDYENHKTAIQAYNSGNYDLAIKLLEPLLTRQWVRYKHDNGTSLLSGVLLHPVTAALAIEFLIQLPDKAELLREFLDPKSYDSGFLTDALQTCDELRNAYLMKGDYEQAKKYYVKNAAQLKSLMSKVN